MGLIDRMRSWAARVANPPTWLSPFYLQSLSGGFWAHSQSNEVITPGRAQSQATVYSCLSLISGALAAPDWEIIREQQGRTAVRNIPAAKALDTLDYAEREGLVWDIWASGNGFARVWRSSTGIPGELERLTASQVTILADTEGRPSYRYADPYAGRTIDLAAGDLIHVRCRTLGLWPLIGVPPVLSSIDTIGLALAMDRYKNTALANGSAVIGTLNTDGKIDRQKAEEIKKRWQDAFAGGNNAGRVAILEQGLKFSAVTCQSLVDLQMAEASRIAAGEIAKLFQIPPAALGDTGNANRGTAQVEMESLYRLCLRPAAVRVADQISRQLLAPADRAQGVRADIDLEAWLRGSGVSLADMLSKLTLAGIATPDEARSFIGLPPAANGSGAALLRPVNMAPADQPPLQSLPTQSTPAPAAEAAAARPAVMIVDLAELRASRKAELEALEELDGELSETAVEAGTGEELSSDSASPAESITIEAAE